MLVSFQSPGRMPIRKDLLNNMVKDGALLDHQIWLSWIHDHRSQIQSVVKKPHKKKKQKKKKTKTQKKKQRKEAAFEPDSTVSSLPNGPIEGWNRTRENLP